MRVYIIFLSGILSALLPLAAVADNTVVVVPMEDIASPVATAETQLSTPMPGGQNLISISPLGGGDYTDLAEAMDDIDTATSNNPFLILLAPGEYVLDAPLQLRPYVSIRGAGKRQTRIIGEVGANSPGSSAALLVSADGSTISGLNVHNSGDYTQNYAIGIYIDCTECQLLDLEVVLDNSANQNYGIYAAGEKAQVTGVDVRVNAPGSTPSIGVYDNASGTEYYRLDVNVTGGAGSCAFNAGTLSDMALKDSRVGVVAGPAVEALRIDSGSDARIINTQVDGVAPLTGQHCFHVFTSSGSSVSC